MSLRKGNTLISGAGLDGISPSATTSKSGDTTTITITDTSGTTTTQIFDGQIIQYSALPTASVDNLGKIVQYIGTTDNTYINGYFYQCIETSGNYSWTNVSVQNSSLPSLINGTLFITINQAYPVYETNFNSTKSAIQTAIKDALLPFREQINNRDVKFVTMKFNNNVVTYSRSRIVTGDTYTYWTPVLDADGFKDSICHVNFTISSYSGMAITCIWQNFSPLFGVIYPIGCIYMSTDSTDPYYLFGGTWTQVNSAFSVSNDTTVYVWKRTA